jgi:hypothetical protein
VPEPKNGRVKSIGSMKRQGILENRLKEKALRCASRRHAKLYRIDPSSSAANTSV